MRRNGISDNDALLLASALKNNTHLRRVNLAHNDITEAGDKTILNAVFDQTSMDSIIESNHTCVIYAWDSKNKESLSKRSDLELESLCINEDDISTKQKIRKKVVLALCGGADGSLFDLSHLNDLPLQLMPRVLELIQKHTKLRTMAVKNIPKQLDKDALSRLFHTLRAWELPLLFENLGSSST